MNIAQKYSHLNGEEYLIVHYNQTDFVKEKIEVEVQFGPFIILTPPAN